LRLLEIGFGYDAFDWVGVLHLREAVIVCYENERLACRHQGYAHYIPRTKLFTLLPLHVYTVADRRASRAQSMHFELLC